MRCARAGWLVVATVWLNIAAPAVHIPRPRPICEAVIRPVFFSASWLCIENSVNAEKFFPAATESRVGVKDLTRLVFVEHAVARQIFDVHRPFRKCAVVVDSAT